MKIYLVKNNKRSMSQIVPQSSNAKQLAILSKAIIILKDSFVVILVKISPEVMKFVLFKKVSTSAHYFASITSFHYLAFDLSEKKGLALNLKKLDSLHPNILIQSLVDN